MDESMKRVKSTAYLIGIWDRISIKDLTFMNACVFSIQYLVLIHNWLVWLEGSDSKMPVSTFLICRHLIYFKCDIRSSAAVFGYIIPMKTVCLSYARFSFDFAQSSILQFWVRIGIIHMECHVRILDINMDPLKFEMCIFRGCVPCDKLFLLSLFIILNWRWTFTKRREKNERIKNDNEWNSKLNMLRCVFFSSSIINQATSNEHCQKMKRLWLRWVRCIKMDASKITGLEFYMLKGVRDENKYVNNIQNSINLPNFHRESKLCISRAHTQMNTYFFEYLSIP